MVRRTALVTGANRGLGLAVAAQLAHHGLRVLLWVRTRMGGRAATRSPEQAADTVVWLATLPDEGPTAGFFKDRKPMEW